MKTSFVRAGVLFFGLVALIGGAALWFVQQPSGDSGKQEPPIEIIPYQKVKENYEISFEDARELVRQPFGTPEAAAVLPHKWREYQEGVFRDAVALLGRVSNDREDAMAIFANRRTGAKRYPAGHSSAVAAILARVAETEGRVMKMEPFMQEFWKPDRLMSERQGGRFIDAIISEKPKGYHHTLAEWMDWLSADERLPKTPLHRVLIDEAAARFYEELRTLTDIISVLEVEPTGTYKEAASRVTKKLDTVYKDSEFYSDYIEILNGSRERAPHQVKDKPIRVSDVPKVK